MINKLKKIIVATTAILFALAPSSFAATKHKFKMDTSWGGGPLMEIGAKAFAKNVSKLSNGRIEIEVFPAGTLGSALKVSETVKNGVADMGHTWMGYDWGKDKTAVLFGGYAGSSDTEKMLHWLYRGGGLKLQEEFRDQKFGLVSMPLFIRTAEVFLHSRKPVRTLKDLQGLKLRTAGAWIEISKSMGASPVTTPGGEVYTALERGTIDATEWGTLWENISPGFDKVTKYVIIPGVHQPTAPFELVINKNSWGKLSKADQQLIRDAAFMTTMDSWLTIGDEDAKAIQYYKSKGNEIIELAPEVQYAGREAGLKWAANIAKDDAFFKKVLDHQNAYFAKWKDASKYRNVLTR
jgi:TRAP-type mannitol/chloroaromatic compound transport system substrate-binding protein